MICERWKLCTSATAGGALAKAGARGISGDPIYFQQTLDAMRWRTVILGGVHDVMGMCTGTTSHRDTTVYRSRKGTVGLGDDPSNDAKCKRDGEEMTPNVLSM